ncbi:MAG: hypothetical protein LRY73_00400 [Bacillus sp. (in: Bacteria)]|nr:hypothetical protein [Bacillus sp. (in: firmicutes)]
MTFGEFVGILVSPVDFVVNNLSYSMQIGLIMIIPIFLIIYGTLEYRRMEME